MSEQPPLTVTEYAAKQRVSAATIYRLVRLGELPAVRVGRSIRIPADALPADGAA